MNPSTEIHNTSRKLTEILILLRFHIDKFRTYFWI